MLNGTTAPASTTTWTVGFVSVEMTGRQKVYVSGGDQNGAAFSSAVNVAGGVVTANQGSMVALPAGSSTIGDVGVMYRTSSTGSAALVAVQSPATPAAATIKASAGRLLGWQLQNSSAAVRSVKVFAVASPTLGTTAAAFEIDIPAGGRSEFRLEGGIIIAAAATYSVTSAKGLTDNTATGLALNDVSGAFFFA